MTHQRDASHDWLRSVQTRTFECVAQTVGLHQLCRSANGCRIFDANIQSSDVALLVRHQRRLATKSCAPDVVALGSVQFGASSLSYRLHFDQASNRSPSLVIRPRTVQGHSFILKPGNI